MIHDELKRNNYYKSAQAVALAVQGVKFEGPLYNDSTDFMTKEYTNWEKIRQDKKKEDQWFTAYFVGVIAAEDHFGNLADGVFESEVADVKQIATGPGFSPPEQDVKWWERRARMLVKLPGFKEACEEVATMLQQNEGGDSARIMRKGLSEEDVSKVAKKHLPQYFCK